MDDVFPGHPFILKVFVRPPNEFQAIFFFPTSSSNYLNFTPFPPCVVLPALKITARRPIFRPPDF